MESAIHVLQNEIKALERTLEVRKCLWKNAEKSNSVDVCWELKRAISDIEKRLIELKQAIAWLERSIA